MRISYLYFLAFMSIFTSCSRHTMRVSVSEGTNMAVSVSPDRSTIAIALQGTIWTMPAKGGRAVSITDELGDCQEPSWSPDGSYLTFHSYRTGNYHIYTVRKDGAELKQLTFGTSDNREPHWSPDGKSIVFSSDRTGNYDIWEFKLADGRLKQITVDPGNDSNPAYSASGKKIAFVSQRSASGLYVSEDTGERPVYLTDMRIAAPSWYGDDRLAFVAFTGRSMLFDDKNTSYIYTVKADGTDVQQISKGSEDLFPFRINWLEDGEMIYSADGKIKKRKQESNFISIIPFHITFELSRPPYSRKAYDFDRQEANPVLGIAGPVVSPDGRKVAFAAMGDIYVQNLGGELIQITKDSHVDLEPDWSPDGNQLAFISDREGNMQVWLHDLRTNDSRLLSPGIKEECYMPSWSRDGKQIAFYTVNYMKKWGPGVLHIANVANGDTTRLYRSISVPSKPTWSPDGSTIGIMALGAHSSRFREGFNQFVMISTKTGASSTVTPDAANPLGMRNQNGPVWSPDGSLIAYVKDGGLWVAPVGAVGKLVGPERQLTSELADNISWTGDSRSLVYLATDVLKKIDVSTSTSQVIEIDLRWKTAQPKDIYIIHAGRLFNGQENKYHHDVDIVVEGNRIAGIARHRTHKEGVEVIDATDQVVMPGLFEMHSHQSSNVGERLGKVWLSYGITSVREPGADPYDALERKEAWESGMRPGPRLFFTGGLTDGTRVAYGLANSVTKPSHIALELDRARRLGYDLIKTYVRMPDSIQKILTEGAHRIGIPLSSHELYPSTRYNVDAIEHLSGTSRRGYSTLLDANFRSYEDVVKLIAESKINITPTACLRTGFFRMAAQYPELLNDSRNTAFLEPDFLQGLSSQTIRADSLRTPRGDENYRALLNTIKAISESGGRITAGTDAPFAPFGSSLHSEIWVFVEAGLSPFLALQTATIRAAEAVGVQADLGTIEKGKLADLIIVDGDPLTRIQDAMKVRMTIKNGNRYRVTEWLKK